MSQAEIDAAISAARSARAAAGITAIDRHHRCAVGCTTVGSRTVRVCLASMAVHICPGCSCKFARTTSEGTVCGLSGYEVAGVDDTITTAFSRDTGVTAVSSRHWGHADRSMGPNRPRSAPKETDQLTRMAVEAQVVYFLSSKTREGIHREELGKVAVQCVKRAKMLREPIGFSGVVASVAEVYKLRSDLCRPPVREGSEWVKTLGKAIFEFWKPLRDRIPMKKKNAPAFVAAVLTMMSDGEGLAIGGVYYIRPSALIRRHCPRPRQFGLFPNMTCRRITQEVRLIKNALTMDNGEPRMIPPLDFERL